MRQGEDVRDAVPAAPAISEVCTSDATPVPHRWRSQKDPHGLCVLTFHRVVECCERDHDVAWRSFWPLLNALAFQRPMIETRLSSPELLSCWALALSFDDGTADHWRVGEELVRQAIKGIFFVPAGLIDTPGFLTRRQVRGLHALGHVIASHGMSHRPLDARLSSQELRRELEGSRRRLEDVLGAPVRYFAPPGGRAGRRVLSLLPACGYTASRSMRWGLYRSPRDRWQIPCVPVTEYVLERGWVVDVIRTNELPTAMRVLWGLKRCIPLQLRVRIRGSLHRPFRRAEG
jgi:peptidoglycan/xylan/chitin deacetylase (PgdA/CDA1 family)